MGNEIEVNQTFKTGENPSQLTKVKLKTQNSIESNKPKKRAKYSSLGVKKKAPQQPKNNFFKNRKLSFLKDGKKQGSP